jgi:hypothetical protein
MFPGLPPAGVRALPRPTSLLHSLLAGAVLAGCVGGTRTTTLTGTSPVPAPDAFECLRKELKSVGFDQTAYDVNELRISARKFDDSQRRPDVQFRRIVERLEIQVAPGSGEAITNLTVDARTFAEYTTHRGPTEEQEKTSTKARTAAQALIQKCSQPVDSLSVPG